MRLLDTEGRDMSLVNVQMQLERVLLHLLNRRRETGLKQYALAVGVHAENAPTPCGFPMSRLDYVNFEIFGLPKAGYCIIEYKCFH